MRPDSFGCQVHDHHTVVIELPEMFAFEKVGFPIGVLEGSIDVGWDTAPHGDVARVVKLHPSDSVVVPPILVPY